jgi:hypothetical protein
MANPSSAWPSGTTVFRDGDPVFISDQQYVVNHLSTKGLPALHLGAVRSTPPARVVLLGCGTGLMPQQEVYALFAHSRVLWVPLGAFDPTADAARYSVDLLLRTDLAKSTAANAKWKHILSRLDRPLAVACDRSSALFRIEAGAAPPQGLIDPVIEGPPGQSWVSIAEYLEVDISSNPAPGSVEPAYAMEGTFWAEGLCVAHDGALPHASPQLERARELAQRVVKAGGVLACIQETNLISALCDGQDISAELIACAGDSGPQVIEFAFGTNHDITDHLDWSINSQLNEGALGVHFGIGDGVSGAHIDFVQPGSRIAVAPTT